MQQRWMPRQVTEVGIVGFGRMGGAMAQHLLRRGWPLAVADPDPAARERARELGAAVAERPAEVAPRADLILVVVVDDDQTKTVVSEMLPACRAGTVVALCASIRPQTCRELNELGAAAGVGVIDVALVRGERGAEQGVLALYCGGDASAVDACRPAFAAFATDVCHLGDVGMGQVAKTANNILLWACLRADTEALRLARALGLDPARLRPAMAIGSGANKPLAEWGQHRLRWPAKDLDVALALAEEAGVEVPFVQALQPLIAELSRQDLEDLK